MNTLKQLAEEAHAPYAFVFFIFGFCFAMGGVDPLLDLFEPDWGSRTWLGRIGVVLSLPVAVVLAVWGVAWGLVLGAIGGVVFVLEAHDVLVAMALDRAREYREATDD